MELNFFSKFKYYFSVIYFKLLSPFECENFRLDILKNEILFSIHAMMRYKFVDKNNGELILIKTRFGRFHIRNLPFDLVTASPAFERQDLDHLLFLIEKSLLTGRKIVFIDIGADFGKYTVSVGVKLRKYSKRLKVFAFEPDKNTFRLLNKNVQANRLSNVLTFNVALSDVSGESKFFYFEPAKMIVSFKTDRTVKVRTEKLDNYIKQLELDDQTDVFIKLDVEGHEVPILEGGTGLMNKSYRVVVLIEDVFNTKNLLKYLTKVSKPIIKLSAQNSFWLLGNRG